LLQEPKSRVARFILRWPVLAGVLAGLVPNALTARFNLVYNRERLVPYGPKLQEQFEDTQIVVNIIAFTIGILGGAWITVRAVRFMKGDATKLQPEGAKELLSFSRWISCLVLTLWTTCGLVFPVAVAWNHDASVDVGVGFYVHFFMSLALCGFAATAYPYFLITAGVVRNFLPALIRSGAIAGPRRQDLESISRFNWLHLTMAGLVPLLGVGLIAFFSSPNPSQGNFALQVISSGGLAGLVAVALLHLRIERDAAALSHLAIDERRSVDRRASSRGSGSRTASSRRP
jgi:eukaryotic-like serine/threonine-protein kinase